MRRSARSAGISAFQMGEDLRLLADLARTPFAVPGANGAATPAVGAARRGGQASPRGCSGIRPERAVRERREDTAMTLHAILILGGVGLVFGVFIAIANKRLWVWEDPRIDIVAQMLPQRQLRRVRPARLPRVRRGRRGGRDRAVAVHGVARRPSAQGDRRTSWVWTRAMPSGAWRACCAPAAPMWPIRRQSTAASAPAPRRPSVAGGGKGCAWGCLGLADCERACTFDAIRMSATGLPVVDVAKCTACGDCVDACPKGLFTILPIDAHLLVQCKNLVSAATTRSTQCQRGVHRVRQVRAGRGAGTDQRGEWSGRGGL